MPGSNPSKGEKKHKVVVIDDDQSALKMVSNAVEKAGYQCLTATNGKEGAQQFKAHRPISLVICDQVMPKITGIELLSRIKQASPQTIRVLITSTEESEVVQNAVNKGEVFRFIKKPADVEEIKKVVQAGIEEYEKNLKTKKMLAEAEGQTVLVKKFKGIAVVLGGVVLLLAVSFGYFSWQSGHEEEPVSVHEEELQVEGLAANPKWQELQTLISNRQYEDALALLAEFDPLLPEVMNTHALVYLKMNRSPDAETWAKESLKTDPHQGIPYAVLGRVYFLSGRFDEAMDTSRQAILYDPKLPIAYRTIGEVYLRRNRVKDALKVLQESDRLEPGNSDVLNVISSTYVRNKDFENARDAALKALKINPDHPGANFNLAIIYFNLGEGEKAMTHNQKAEDLFLELEETHWLGKARHNKKLIMKKFNIEEPPPPEISAESPE